MMTKPGVVVVQKARYGILLLPVLWLIFSFWIIFKDVFPAYSDASARETRPASPDVLLVTLTVFAAVWIAIGILRDLRNRILVSPERKSALAFSLGMSLMALGDYLRFFPFLGVALVDIADLIMIATLLQRKPFGGLTLYHKDIRIQGNA